jgi:hypothetical protein
MFVFWVWETPKKYRKKKEKKLSKLFLKNFYEKPFESLKNLLLETF